MCSTNASPAIAREGVNEDSRWKTLFRALIRSNRAKHTWYHLNGTPERDMVVREAKQNWFHPMAHQANKEWLVSKPPPPWDSEPPPPTGGSRATPPKPKATKKTTAVAHSHPLPVLPKGASAPSPTTTRMQASTRHPGR